MVLNPPIFSWWESNLVLCPCVSEWSWPWCQLVSEGLQLVLIFHCTFPLISAAVSFHEHSCKSLLSYQSSRNHDLPCQRHLTGCAWKAAGAIKSRTDGSCLQSELLQRPRRFLSIKTKLVRVQLHLCNCWQVLKWHYCNPGFQKLFTAGIVCSCCLALWGGNVLFFRGVDVLSVAF